MPADDTGDPAFGFGGSCVIVLESVEGAGNEQTLHVVAPLRSALAERGDALVQGFGVDDDGHDFLLSREAIKREQPGTNCGA
jgi:hypothetical protein